jgi:tetratricopeptide (TPR) repeat protein
LGGNFLALVKAPHERRAAHRAKQEKTMTAGHPGNRELIERCRTMLDRSEYALLIEEMSGFHEDRPNLAELAFAVGYARMKLGDLPQAASCLARAVGLKPDMMSVNRLYFSVLWQLGRKVELTAALDDYVGRDGGGPDADLLRGSWLHRIGQSRKARDILGRGIAAAPDRYDLRHVFGLAALDNDESEAAALALRSAVVLKPDSMVSYQPLGIEIERRRDLSAARRILHRGVLLGDRRAVFPLTRVLRSLNRFEESMALARRANLDQIHFRSGTMVGSLDRGDIVDFDGYEFRGAAEIAPAELLEGPAAIEPPPDAGNKWHFQAKTISFFPRSVDDFADLKKLVEEHVISRSIPSEPLFRSDANVLTMGSCFAGHLRKRLLAKRKSTELISVPEGLNNTFALRQFIEWSLTGEVASTAYWYDQHDDGGIEQWTPPKEHLFYREKFHQFDGFVITIGLSEVWRDKETGGVFWRGVPRAIYDEGRHAFQISSVEENTENILAIVELVRLHCGSKPIVFTLSPVPLIATHRTDVTCMVADSVSKSILRVAIDQVMRRRLDGVYYWPSFEIVRWASSHAAYRAFGDDDGAPRHVNENHVDAIIDAFTEHFFYAD